MLLFNNLYFKKTYFWRSLLWRDFWSRHWLIHVLRDSILRNTWTRVMSSSHYQAWYCVCVYLLQYISVLWWQDVRSSLWNWPEMWFLASLFIWGCFYVRLLPDRATVWVILQRRRLQVCNEDSLNQMLLTLLYSRPSWYLFRLLFSQCSSSVLECWNAWKCFLVVPVCLFSVNFRKLLLREKIKPL